MSDPTRLTPEQLTDLMVARATQGLDETEQQQYDQLIANDTELSQQAQSFEIAAAHLDAAWATPPSQDMPEHLRQALLAQAQEHL